MMLAQWALPQSSAVAMPRVSVTMDSARRLEVSRLSASSYMYRLASSTKHARVWVRLPGPLDDYHQKNGNAHSRETPKARVAFPVMHLVQSKNHGPWSPVV